MDYTTLAHVKAAMDSKETKDDTLLSEFITRASRYIDKLCTSQPNVADYFKLETVTDEILTNGVVDYRGDLYLFPHKSVTISVSALSYRYSLKSNWISLDPTLVLPMQEMILCEASLPSSTVIYAKITYNGGLGADVASLPKDFVDMATIMTIRLYKEARSGLGDSIGVAELGMLVYTKAFPQRILETLNIGSYMRIASWT
jgi:hypothetical protein